MADAFADEVDNTVTIDEYIEDMEAAELQADMVLGGDEGKECTYSRGYMKRQAIFSCLTCVPAGNAGVCTACSISCHDGHEIVELWTKRSFKCDCGNSKFGLFSCKLFAGKDSENSENCYNQNFQGLYCTCHRPYPDPEAEEQVEMIQCCICEDWFHENHIGLESNEEIPKDEEGEPSYDDFVCQDCSLSVSFLNYYPASIFVPRTLSKAVVDEDKSKCLNEQTNSITIEKVENESSVYESSTGCPAGTDPVTLSGQGSFHIESSGLDLERSAASSDTNKCFIGLDLGNTAPCSEVKKSLFLSKKWRERLCRCGTCCEFYLKKGIGYLIDKDDSIEEYEKVAKERRAENIEKREGDAMNFINGLDHVQKIEFLNGIADMRNEFTSFLQSHDSSKPITAADVKGIFENLSKKRQRLV